MESKKNILKAQNNFFTSPQIKSNQQTFVLSPEMKEVMKKRAAKKKQKEEEEEKMRQAEEEAKKEAAAKAWQAWKARKEEGIKLKKHMTKNEEEEKKKAEKVKLDIKNIKCFFFF